MATTGNEFPFKVDLHAHYLPQAYLEALRINCQGADPDGFPTPDWQLERHVEMMNHLGIAFSLLSLSSPHINFGDREATRLLARQVNEDGADIVKRYPGKFGLMASLPLPDVEDSIEEIRYAMDVLHVDGFALPTNSRGVYLGDPDLDPILDELNRHKAVVVLHPNTPGRVPANVAEGLPMPLMEFFFDSTRTVINLILKRVLTRFRDIKFVVPHAGALLPVLADRLAAVLRRMPELLDDELLIGEKLHQIDMFAELNMLYYDVAGVCLPRQLDALIQIVDTGHLFYGSDYPYTPESLCAVLAKDLDDTELLTQEQHQRIYCDNALELFPRLNAIAHLG